MDEDTITVTKGIQPGLILVVAGVQFLREGLKVRPLESKGTEQ